MSDLPKQLQSKELLQIIGGICLGVAGISLLVFFCIFNKIRRAVAIMKAASDFVREQCLIILLPIVKFIIICGFLAFWVVVSLYIYSSGTVKANPDSPFGKLPPLLILSREINFLLFFFQKKKQTKDSALIWDLGCPQQLTTSQLFEKLVVARRGADTCWQRILTYSGINLMEQRASAYWGREWRWV